MLMPAMQLLRNLNEYCCVTDRTNLMAKSLKAGISFPLIQFPGTPKAMCCSFRGK